MAESEKTELLVHGYIDHCNLDNHIPLEIIKLCILFCNEEFKWILNMNDLISMKQREYMISLPIIYNDDLSFHCKVYSSSKGFRKIRLHLLSMNNNLIKHCVVSSSLYCDEIDAYSRQVYKYCPNSNKTKHSIRILLNDDHQKYEHKQLTIRCNIYSVQVTFNDQRQQKQQKLLYYPFDRKHEFKKEFEFTWNVNNLLLSSFVNCPYGASYFSPDFNDWNILCTPNGASYRVKGKFQIGLQIIKWPKNIKSMDILFIVNGTFDNKPKQYEKHFDIEINQTEFYCNKNTFDLQLITNKLSFNVKIKIKQIKDQNNKIIPTQLWKKYNIY